MLKRVSMLLVLSCLVAGLIGCAKAASPTPVSRGAETPPLPPMAPTSTPTQEPPSPTPTFTVKPSPTATEVLEPTATEEPEPTATPLGRPALLVPPDGLTAQLFDLMWAWEGKLGECQWFEVRIWPDQPGDQPVDYFWTRERCLRITSAMLLPGRYRWEVVAVSGDGESPGEELYPASENWSFIITRPHTLARMSVTPPTVPSRTPSLTPSPTRTRIPWAIATNTPTPTSTSEPTVPQPTVPEPTATSTTEPTVPEPTATNTPEPPPTATATTYPYS